MWKLYDELIEKIPDDITADSITAGPYWTVVTAGNYCGTAMTVNEHEPVRDIPGYGEPKSLKELAFLVKSWNFAEASIGAAAINAYYNNKETWKETLLSGTAFCEIVGSENPFESYAQAVKNKKVAIVGHFKHVKDYFIEAENVSVLERKPTGDDYPDSACEYILPQQDFVFITGSALVNKTLPRLLQLSERAKVVLVGPSTPMTPGLFRYGVDEVSGFIAVNKNSIIEAVSKAEQRPCPNDQKIKQGSCSFHI